MRIEPFEMDNFLFNFSLLAHRTPIFSRRFQLYSQTICPTGLHAHEVRYDRGPII